MASDPDQLWSYAEFAAWLGVPENTARAWVQRGQGPRAVKLGRHVRIRVGDALDWLSTRQGGGAA